MLYNDPEIRHEVLDLNKEKGLRNAIFKKCWEAMVFSWLERASGRGEASALLHTHEVEGSSPPVSTKYRKPEPNGSGFVYFRGLELEPISMQYAGGLLWPPVQKLVVTLISSSPPVSTKSLKTIGFQGFFCFSAKT